VNTLPIRVGISSCLLGQLVRYDGGHKRDRFATDLLSEYFEWVPVCPEVEIGMGTPREPIRLERRRDGDVRLVTINTRNDLTAGMQRFAKRRATALARENLSGYLFKKDSPSCGVHRVKIYPNAKGQARREGRGLFAAAVADAYPNLPIEDEGRLCDARLRENWIQRVFAYHGLQQLWRPRWTIGELVAFHTRYKLVVMSHDEPAYRALGRLIAEAKTIARSELRERYDSQFMAALTKIATPRKNTNVLQHMCGFLKKKLDAASRQELAEQIEDYRTGLVPLIVPLTLIRHYVRLHKVENLANQVYLHPHPKQLSLLNHV
jgi:uncharacterized protein YbgA (DUF1722 family)/uncharacterized protein YbbK (DUF523 family)